ncbi:MAG: cytochrome-c peroxidase [Pseudomonadota bacterium]
MAAIAVLATAGCGKSDRKTKAAPQEAQTAAEIAPSAAGAAVGSIPLGLPPVPAPAANPVTVEKVRLGNILFNDKRFSSTGEVSCATCHDPAKGFTDGPLAVSEGVNKLTGTRNAPTVINAAFYSSQFWDGRRASLEEQSGDPFLNPVEMNLPSHGAIVKIVSEDPAYQELFRDAFGAEPAAITMDHVKMAIASFERTIVSGNSPFDRWRYGGEEGAISDQARRGFDLFIAKGRCVSCHTISETHALFTDSKFHNVGIGFSKISKDAEKVVGEFLRVAKTDQAVDEAVLGDVKISEIGRFAVSREMQDIGQFKTPTLRNIAATAPYMHDGSLRTLREVVQFYNTAISPHEDQNQEPNPFQSGGIRPLNLTEAQIDDLVAFLETLTSPEFEEAARASLANQAKIAGGK